MKILWIARTCPFPPNDGEKIRVLNLLKNLSHHEITLVFRVMRENELEHLSEVRKYCYDIKYAYIPSPKSNFARLRLCLPFLFSKYPISLCTVFFPEIVKILRRLCSENSYDIIQVEHSALTIYLDYLSFLNNPSKIVTLHNIDYLRYERSINYQDFNTSKLFYYINQLKYKKWELASLNSYDRIITVSEFDRSELLKNNNSLEIDIIPNGVDLLHYHMIHDYLDSKKHTLLFVASMDSEANNDAAIYLLKSIYPLVKTKYPDACIYIVGRRPSSQLLAYHNNNDIIVTGEVPDVVPFYKIATVTVIPLRIGGGTRLKILEAMAVGSPIVTTSIGCEGLEVENNKHLLIADNPDNFSACILKLFEDNSTRNRLISQSRSLVEAQYDWRMIAAKQDNLYKEVGKRYL